ncbi:hypothetical protein NC651_036856 [Populus alba x Populus x berolinensis]|nr:hypothetical protein NC651_036856 [Populus alba x Populus x berolinensis]
MKQQKPKLILPTIIFFFEIQEPSRYKSNGHLPPSPSFSHTAPLSLKKNLSAHLKHKQSEIKSLSSISGLKNISLNSFTARMASLVSRRAPLGDLSNSMKAVASRIPHDASKMKSISKAPGKWQTAGRKPLSDISNSRNPEKKKKFFQAVGNSIFTAGINYKEEPP